MPIFIHVDQTNLVMTEFIHMALRSSWFSLGYQSGKSQSDKVSPSWLLGWPIRTLDSLRLDRSRNQPHNKSFYISWLNVQVFSKRIVPLIALDYGRSMNHWPCILTKLSNSQFLGTLCSALVPKLTQTSVRSLALSTRSSGNLAANQCWEWGKETSFVVKRSHLKCGLRTCSR